MTPSESFTRITRLHFSIVRRVGGDMVRRPADLVVLSIGPLLLLAISAPALSAAGHAHPLALAAGTVAVAALSGRTMARALMLRQRALIVGGVLTSSLLEGQGWRQAALLIQALALTSWAVASIALAAITHQAWLSAETAIGYAAGAALGTVIARPVAVGPRRWAERPTKTERLSLSPVRTATVILERCVGRRTSVPVALSTCAGLGILSAIAAAGVRAASPTGADMALLALPGVAVLYLTRRDVDLWRALSLAGSGVTRSTAWMLAPAWSTAIGYGGAAVLLRLGAIHVAAMPMLALATSILSVLRGWRVHRMGRRAVDLMTLVDLLVAAALATLLLPLGPIWVIARLFQLYRSLRMYQGR